MFYRKAMPYKRVTKTRTLIADFSGGINAFADENLLPFKYSPLAYNFYCKNGALTHCKGIDRLNLAGGQIQPLSADIIKLYFYRRYDPQLGESCDKLLAYCADKNMYYIDIDGGGEFTQLLGVQFEKAPSGINYRLNGEDVIILCSERDCMTVWNGSSPPYRVESAPFISSMCVHYERLFATVDGEKASVWFSDDLDPTNWDISLEGGGYIEILGEKGSLLKVIKFLDYVYIFRSYGISRVTAYGEQTDFSVITLYTSSGRIYPDTVSVCGDRIIFLAQDGIYSFDGLKTAKILSGIFPLLRSQDNSYAVSAYYNGCYYLACRIDFEEDESGQNNALIEYDISSGSCAVIKCGDISSLTVIAAESFNALAVAVRGENADKVATICSDNALFGEPLKKCWKTPWTDLGCPDKFKVIREISVCSDGEISAEIHTENFCRNLYFKGGQCFVKVNLRCKKFKLHFYSETAKARIIRPLICADII